MHKCVEKQIYCDISVMVNYKSSLYNYNFNPIKNMHLRHVIVHYFSRIVQPEAYFFRIGRPDKSVFFSYYFRIAHYVREVARWFLSSGACINGGTFNVNINLQSN